MVQTVTHPSNNSAWRRVTTLNWWRLPLPLKNATILLLTELCLADLSQVLDDDDDVLDSLEDSWWREVFPLWAVSVLVPGPASPWESHPHAHWRETIHVWLLWSVIPPETAATSSHQPLPRSRLRASSTARKGWSTLACSCLASVLCTAPQIYKDLWYYCSNHCGSARKFVSDLPWPGPRPSSRRAGGGAMLASQWIRLIVELSY